MQITIKYLFHKVTFFPLEFGVDNVFKRKALGETVQVNRWKALII